MRNRSIVILALSLLTCVPPADAAPAAESLSHVFKRVGNSVAVIRTLERVATPDSREPVRTEALGSGVLISSDGKVITAAHVVQTADAIAVQFPDTEPVAAKVIAADTAADVALLQLETVPQGAVTAKLGDSNKAEVGDQIFVVGAPFGISHTLTVGHLSARRQANTTYGGMTTAELFQTDAAINQGNSGGPMFNLAGEVIGVVSHILSRSGGSEGLGFVVTSNLARKLLLDEPSVWSGLEGYLLTGELARALNLPGSRAGVLVQRVASNSPAEQFGLRGGLVPVAIGEDTIVLGGDVVLAVQGITLQAENAYEDIRRRLIEARAANDSIRVVVLRGGQLIELTGEFTH
jgi:S1-C subfamily serine protease